MPSRKYSTKKKRTYRKRKFNITRKKRIMPSGRLRMLRWSCKNTAQSCHILITGNDTLPDSVGTTTFTYSDVEGFAEMNSLFDNYRILKVLYRWVITRNPDWATTTANRGWSTRIFWRHDFNDQVNITQQQLFQGANLREAYLNTDKLHTKWYSIKPASLTQIYESATQTAYGPKWGQWMDTNDYTPHYGIKYGFQNLYAGINLRLECKYIMEFKGIS